MKMGQFDIIPVLRTDPRKWWTVRELSYAMGYKTYSNRVNHCSKKCREWGFVYAKEFPQVAGKMWKYKYKLNKELRGIE